MSLRRNRHYGGEKNLKRVNNCILIFFILHNIGVVDRTKYLNGGDKSGDCIVGEKTNNNNMSTQQ